MCLQEKQRDNRHDIRRTTDQGKCREQNQSLYILFVHLTKAFDTVGRWVGHVFLMDEAYLPKMVFFSKVASGTRSIGHPLKRSNSPFMVGMAVHKDVQGFEKSG